MLFSVSQFPKHLLCFQLITVHFLSLPIFAGANSVVSPAVKLAGIINSNEPTDISKEMTFQELQAALGNLHETQLGWRERTDSFFDFLKFNKPEVYDEDTLESEKDFPFTTPVLVKRKNGGVASFLAKRLKKKNILKGKLLVKPSRCSSLALNYNDTWPTVNPRTGTWDARIRPFTRCPECEIPFQRFHALSSRPFDLATPASDPGNIQLQTHGIQGWQMKPLKMLFKRHFSRPNAMYSHSNLRKSFLHPDCHNNPAMGYAASLRGLPFHKHQANLNEVLVGRKLWMIFPPRSTLKEPHSPCPWPPWKPNGVELPQDSSFIDRILQSFFHKEPFERNIHKIDGNESKASNVGTLRSCLDQNMTPLQWLIYEYPKMKSIHKPFMFVVYPAEVVWIPDDWPHATINIDDVWYVHKGSCADQRQKRMDKMEMLQSSIQRTCDRTGRFCTEYCHAGNLCSQCNGYNGVICNRIVNKRNKRKFEMKKQEEL
jgi:hypothetical protein